MNQISGLSSQLFLTLHDPFTGQAQVGQELLEFGVGAAEFADLIIAQRLQVVGDHVTPGPATQPPTGVAVGPAGDFAFGAVAEQEQTYSVRTWVTTSDLTRALTDLVAEELLAAQVVRHERPRVGLRARRQDRFPAVDLLRASHSRNRVRHMLSHPQEFDLPGATLALLVDALGAVQIFEVDAPQQVLAELRVYLPPPLRSVVAGLSASVAAASVALRGGAR